MKKLLFLLLITAVSYGQTYHNPTFGTVTTKTSPTVTNDPYVTTTGTTGIQGKIAPVNLIIPHTPVNYTVPNLTIGAHLSGIDTRLGQISSTTAGLTQRIYFTADDTTVNSVVYFASNSTGKGATAAGSPPALVLADNTKGYFTKDLISIPQPAATIGYAGSYSGNLTVSATPTPVATQQRFTVEVYRTNNLGTPIDSGVSGAPVGDLGITVVAILDSGIINLAAGSITNVSITGILTQNITINTGERLRYHVSAAKIGAGGGNVTFGVYYGSSYNSYYDVPVAITTDAVVNKSTVSGVTDTDALNNLKTADQTVAGSGIPFGHITDVAQTIAGQKTFKGTTASDSAPLGAELATTASGINWTGTSLTTGYTHTVGSTENLVDASLAVIGTTYRINTVITGRTAGSISITYGGVQYATGQSTSIATARQATATSGLVITPTSDFDGTVSININSVGNSTASFIFANSLGSNAFDIRASSETSNVFIGRNSGRKGIAGNVSNVFLGNDSGSNNSVGRQNTFIGTSSGSTSASGDGNTAIGYQSFFNNITGFNSIAIGFNALYGNTIGNDNIGIGVAAGRHIFDGANHAINNSFSIFIGQATKALGQNQTNQIVIGNGTIGLGSNTTIIGNSSTTHTALYGNLLIGTTTNNGNRFRLSGAAELITTPTTSAGSYDILTRNTSTGVVEKIPSSGLATSGTYTPTATDISNVPTITSQVSTYTRIGNIVTVNVRGLFTPTTAATASVFSVTLPINRANSTTLNIGSGSVSDAGNYFSVFCSTTSTTTANLYFKPTTNTANQIYSVTFMYDVTN